MILRSTAARNTSTIAIARGNDNISSLAEDEDMRSHIILPTVVEEHTCANARHSARAVPRGRSFNIDVLIEYIDQQYQGLFMDF